MTILETLPGWPHADEPSVMAVLLLLVLVPAAVLALFWVLGMGRHWFSKDPSVAVHEPSLALDTQLAIARADGNRELTQH